jgi:hypothetical protein
MTTRAAQPARYETICGTCGKEHSLGYYYNHNFVAQGRGESVEQEQNKAGTVANATDLDAPPLSNERPSDHSPDSSPSDRTCQSCCDKDELAICVVCGNKYEPMFGEHCKPKKAAQPSAPATKVMWLFGGQFHCDEHVAGIPFFFAPMDAKCSECSDNAPESLLSLAHTPTAGDVLGDQYTDGYCKRCGRKRAECQKIIDTGKRCTAQREQFCNTCHHSEHAHVAGYCEMDGCTCRQSNWGTLCLNQR